MGWIDGCLGGVWSVAKAFVGLGVGIGQPSSAPHTPQGAQVTSVKVSPHITNNIYTAGAGMDQNGKSFVRQESSTPIIIGSTVLGGAGLYFYILGFLRNTENRMKETGHWTATRKKDIKNPEPIYTYLDESDEIRLAPDEFLETLDREEKNLESYINTVNWITKIGMGSLFSIGPEHIKKAENCIKGISTLRKICKKYIVSKEKNR